MAAWAWLDQIPGPCPWTLTHRDAGGSLLAPALCRALEAPHVPLQVQWGGRLSESWWGNQGCNRTGNQKGLVIRLALDRGVRILRNYGLPGGACDKQGPAYRRKRLP